MVVGHHRVVAGFLNAKYRHGITSLRRLEKVFVFGENAASMLPGHSGGGKPMGSDLSADCGRKNMGFSTPFGTVVNWQQGIPYANP